MRAETEAPFRTLRLVIYGFSIASASVATLISLPQLAGALGGARGALVLDDVLQNLAINIGAVTIFGFLFAQDWKVGLAVGAVSFGGVCRLLVVLASAWGPPAVAGCCSAKPSPIPQKSRNRSLDHASEVIAARCAYE